MTELQRTLNRLLRQSGKSTTQVAKLGGCDRAYLIRLLDGTKQNPSAETLLRIYLGLVFDPELAAEYPTIVHGLAELMLSASMSQATSLAEER
jgi:hypothetical protein